MDARQPPKKMKGFLGHLGMKTIDLDIDSFPLEVHAVVEEKTVEVFECQKLGFREVLSDEMPNFRGQVCEDDHRKS